MDTALSKAFAMAIRVTLAIIVRRRECVLVRLGTLEAHSNGLSGHRSER
jgi:hypothetical protein